jgi:DNA repair protein RadA/Sms
VGTLGAGNEPPERITTRVSELDRVLGGGLVPGAVVLLAGDPGIGKSTLVLQMLDGLRLSHRRALLASGEESMAQVSLRARRLRVAGDELRATATTSIDAVLEAARAERAQVLVVDSIQTLTSPGAEGRAGSVAQVRECTAALVRHAKETGTVVVLVGHVTKEGGVAGPKTLEHIVDVVLLLEGERTGALRLLRATKNRFGSCDETGVFTMTDIRLEPVPDPSAMLLADRRPGATGSVVFPGLEGNRPVLVEIQALVCASTLAQPRRVAIGVEARRLSLLTGVLSQHSELDLGQRDVFVAAAGGLAVREPAADLAIALALYSAATNVAVDPGVVAVGEVGLSGEIRRVPGLQRRLAEAARLRFAHAIVSPTAEVPRSLTKVGAVAVSNAFELVPRRAVHVHLDRPA